MVQYFNWEDSRIMERFVPMVSVRRREGDAVWFDGDCRRAFELKQSAYHRWCRNRTAVNWDLFCQAGGTANRHYSGESSLIAVGILMIVPLLMLGGVCLKIMCLVRSQMYLLVVLLEVCLFRSGG